MSMLKENISYAVSKMLLLKPNNDGKLKEMYNYATTQSSTGKSRREREQKWLQAICKKLETIIDLFPEDKKKIINKFLCQLFFLIFFTNKVDIKPENILVKKNDNNVKIKNDNNVKIIHTDVANFPCCTGMFDKFENHERLFWYFNKLFLKTIWKRISSKELSEYFNEYVGRYKLTEDKIKKIISRTVRNFFRSNDDIGTNKINVIDSDSFCIKDTCQRLFAQMSKYMQYMLNTVIKEIELDDGNDEKKSQLINVLEQNCKVLNALQDDEINKCVDDAIAKYNKQKYHPQSNINESDNKVKESDNKVENSTTNINPGLFNNANGEKYEDNGANSTNNIPTYTLCSNFCKNPYIGWDEYGNWHCCL